MNPKSPRISSRKTRQSQNRSYVAEEDSFSLFLSVPHRTPLGQPECSRWPSAEHSLAVSGQGEG